MRTEDRLVNQTKSLFLPQGTAMLLPERNSVCPTHSEAKHHQNAGVWDKERFIAGPCREMGGSCLKKPPKLPEIFQQSPFIGKVREGHG